MSDFTLKVIGYLLSVVFLYLTFKDTSIELIIRYLEYINYYYILIGLILIIIFHFIRSLYQQNNLKYLNPKLSFSVSLQSIALAYFFNSILPARLGEVVRAFFLSKKNNIRKTPILSYILVEKIIDVIFIFFILFFIFVFTGTDILQRTDHVEMLFVILLFLIASIIIFLYFNRHLASIFKYIVPKKYHSIASRINFDIHEGFNCFRSISQIIKAFILLILGWILVMATYYFISLPYIELLGLPDYSFLYFLVFTALALTIPSAPAGIGVVHYGLYLSVSILNPDIVDKDIDLVAAFIISLHFFIYVIDIIASGSIILFQKWKGNLIYPLKSYYFSE